VIVIMSPRLQQSYPNIRAADRGHDGGLCHFYEVATGSELEQLSAVDRKSSAPSQNDGNDPSRTFPPVTFGYIAASELVVANPIIDRNHEAIHMAVLP
jgi:hypothetical protein